MKFLFIIQGEGRGHMTQAISMTQMLGEMGHEVCAVCIGKSQRREIPEFVSRNIHAPIYLFDSPNFVTDKSQKSINLSKTIWGNLLKFKTFKKSLEQIDQLVKKHQPDVILNFYDILGGIYNALYRPECQFWVIGHQYLIHHPEFPFAPGQPLQKLLFKINTHITSLGADLLLALSFRPMPAHQIHNLHVLPPLLRKEVRNLNPTQGDFFLAYMVNPGYAEEVISEAKNNPEIQIEAFWDKKDEPISQKPLPNLTIHMVDDKLFLEKMATCKGLLSTAGFESVCEALYLGKQVLMVPVKGQYEQACNAIDAQISGAGLIGEKFDFKKLDAYLKAGTPSTTTDKEWIDSFQFIFHDFLRHSLQNKKEVFLIDFTEEIPAL
ncbi:glycosyltransferase family protein [Cognataquiflexum rubidum]|uniref:glycosyltransferase family protein n=1 Tax=Cognataquiflexum rubidum TaxID=2922273 RepID=UPI001F149181|nr:glycosyltransferase family protein [Cognataquiflexum rubidum]MCH6234828.1 glycosyltransferase [Cognataquiflexum rubidum]